MRIRVIKQETQEKQELAVPVFMEEFSVEAIIDMYTMGIISQVNNKQNYGIYIIELYTVDDFNREQVLTRSRLTARPTNVDGITVDIPLSAFCPN